MGDYSDSDSDYEDGWPIFGRARFQIKDPDAVVVPQIRQTCDNPFVNCNMEFENEEKMKKHKKKEHEFCEYCNMDFKDYNDHLAHRIEIDKTENDEAHITCWHCGLDAHTRKARDFHVIQAHPMKQELYCPICEDMEPFTSAADFMRHLEQGRCPRIDPSGLKGVKKHKEFLKEALANPQYFEADFQDEDDDNCGADAAEGDGGVALLDSDLPDIGSMSLHPALQPVSVDKVGGAPAEQQRWPKLPSSGGIALGKDKAVANTVNTGEKALTPDQFWAQKQAKEAKVGGSSSKTPSPPSKTQPAVQGIPEPNHAASLNMFHDQFWNPNSKHYDDKRFFKPLSNKWRCPFATCRVYYDNPVDMKAHLFHSHANFKLDCEICWKEFKTLSQFVHHVDRPNDKCYLWDVREFKETCDKYSAGTLKAEVIWREDCTERRGIKWEVCKEGLEALAAPKTIAIHQAKVLNRRRGIQTDEHEVKWARR